MPSEYHFGYYIFAPNGRFEPCGMFTFGHIFSALLCVTAVICSLRFLRSKMLSNKYKITRVTAIVLTILEAVKISHSFIYGELHLDAWFPLSYCGLFIFALWMTGYGNTFIKRAGETFICYGCPIAGTAFLIFPTTSLMSFPIWHYFSLYSMLFHSVMIFFGVCYLSAEDRLDKKAYTSYACFVLFFSAVAIIMNSLFICNLMNLREPYNIPIAFLQNLYSTFPAGYTVLVVVAYSIIPFVVGGIFGKIKQK